MAEERKKGQQGQKKNPGAEGERKDGGETSAQTQQAQGRQGQAPERPTREMEELERAPEETRRRLEAGEPEDFDTEDIPPTPHTPPRQQPGYGQTQGNP